MDLKTTAGEIDHAGGLTLSAGGTRVELSAFVIELNSARAMLTGLAVANDSFVGRIALFDLGLGAARISATTSS